MAGNKPERSEARKPTPAERAVGRMAERTAASVEFFELSCRSAAQRSGREPVACEPLAETAKSLRAMASCLRDTDCLVVGDAAAAKFPAAGEE